MKTLDFILNLKYWQVFLILIICGFLKVFEWGAHRGIDKNLGLEFITRPAHCRIRGNAAPQRDFVRHL